jgi:U3 small nucleolar RNA-associated protein 10
MVVSNVASLLGSRKWFPDDESQYESFCLDNVVPCFTSLAIGVGRDTLWKPLNHAILMMTRDKKKIVRVVCVKALHKLFSDVGEDYLILLPESLPFLSELLEDTNPAVTAATSELVRYIEEISGESLDTYLQ